MTTTPAPAAAVGALQQALAAEHAAVYAYGVVGARLPVSRRAGARSALDAHQARRDALVALVSAAGAEAVAAEPGYALPRPVRTASDAETLAVLVEERVAATYADVVASADGQIRRLAATALREAAVRAALWRDASVPFPGLPERAGG
jgi:hypothetical protein